MKLIDNLKFYKKELIIGPIFKLLETIIEVGLPILIARVIDLSEEKIFSKLYIVIIFLPILGVCFASISQYMAAKVSAGYEKSDTTIFIIAHTLSTIKNQIELLLSRMEK